MIHLSLIDKKQVFRRRFMPLAISLCILAALPLWADDPAPASASPSPAPATTSAPVLDAPTPILRPVPLPEGTLAPDALAANNPSTPTSSSASSGTPPPTPPSAPVDSSAPATPSQNVTINLINLMVKRGLITKEDAADLIKQAEQEAAAAQATAQAAPAQNPGANQASALPGGPTPAVPAEDDTVHVTYVPDVVKNQIRDEVKADVMKQAEDEHWSSADTTPEWVHRFHVTGDIRTRYEGDFFPDGNVVGTPSTYNFNAINTGSPLEINTLAPTPTSPTPTYNVDQNRNRFRLRARIGAGIDLGENFFAGMRIGTGSDDQPVSENQTLGGANGQGGNFSKYQIWLDRAFIRYELGAQPDKDFSISFGRFDNPFFSSTMIWGDDIGFDGFMAKGKYEVADGVTPFLTAGAFPVFNTDLNFGTNSTGAGNGYQSEDKWLYAVQGGTTWIINKDFTLKGAVAFYDFENIEGQVSSPISQNQFANLGTNFNGDSDDSRPSFAQHGNTYIALRNVVLDSPVPSTPVYEYYGLASRFQELALTGQLDYSHFDPFHIWLVGEYVNNLAFDRAGIINEGPGVLPGPQNNLDGTSYSGGGEGYNVRLNVGAPALEKLWDWNVYMTYRYLQSDAVVDAFNDTDFGGYLSGTNLKGYILGGNLALSKRIWTGMKVMEADSIAGPTLKIDTIQVDLNAKF